MSNIWLISDLHLFHQRIIEYAERPFSDVLSMNKAIIDNWKATVSKKDKVFVLGDIGFSASGKLDKIIFNLPGYKVLIRGNHDKSFTDSKLMNMGFKEIYKYPIILEKKYILSHAPLDLELGDFKNIHGHLHQKFMDEPNYINISVENINYTPVNFEILKLL